VSHIFFFITKSHNPLTPQQAGGHGPPVSGAYSVLLARGLASAVRKETLLRKKKHLEAFSADTADIPPPQ